MLAAMFADPALAADPAHANVLRAYLREDSIPPLPLRRLAAAYPANVDPGVRRVLGTGSFSWSQNGSGLLRKRKPGYYAAEPLPGVAVLSDRVLALARGAVLAGPMISQYGDIAELRYHRPALPRRRGSE